MDKKDILTTLKKLKETSKKRNFKQSIDLIINLKNLDLKKPENQLDFSIPVHHSRSKEIKVCALVGPELLTQAKDICDMAINLDDFDKYAKNKKLTKKLTKEYDFFIAQANVMPKVAASFGKVLGPREKMPNPKFGCIVAPNANLKPLYEKLKKIIKVSIKKSLQFQCIVGKEGGNEEEVVDNIITIYNSLIHHLPREKHNIKNVCLKLTMSPSLKIGAKETQEEAKEHKKKKSKEPKKDGEDKDKPKEETKKEDDNAKDKLKKKAKKEHNKSNSKKQ